MAPKWAAKLMKLYKLTISLLLGLACTSQASNIKVALNNVGVSNGYVMILLNYNSSWTPSGAIPANSTFIWTLPSSEYGTSWNYQGYDMTGNMITNGLMTNPAPIT